MKTLGTTDADITEAAELIKAGKLVAFPTETVYGVGASLYNVSAVDAIFKAKCRPYSKPLAAHISNLNMVVNISAIVPDLFYDLANIFLPGPLTIIIPATSSVPPIVTSNTGTIAVRFPANTVCQRFIDAVGSPIAATSVNISEQEPAAINTNQFADNLKQKISAVIDNGESTLKVASTVISLVKTPTVLREGYIKIAEIEGKIGRKLMDNYGRANLR